MWNVVGLAPFRTWFDALDENGQDDVVHGVGLLREFGPMLGRPAVDSIKGSLHANMKELRIQSKGRPLRVFFAFDPARKAVLLIGGDKTGDKRFYARMVPLADELFSAYLSERGSDAKNKNKR